ncbi:MAG: hypothetical protein VX938_00145, partial [Myxococcota bacterium]|nr:hypothetical protein [Myxococcota bacterium]
ALKAAEADFAAYAKTPRGEARKALLRERGEGALWGLAAELGSGDACFLMAKAYDVGLGASRGSGLDRFPEISGDAAGLWYHRGAVRGNGFCQGNHGGLVPEGAQALGWYRLAAAQGVESAQYNLANLLARRGDPTSMSEALYWAKKTSGGSLAQQVQETLGELQSKGVEARSPAELSIDDGASESTQGRLLKSKELELPLRSGDVITAIDGVSVVGVPHSEAVGPLHGAFGSAVSLSVQRSDGTTEDVSVVRRWLNHSLSPVDLSSLPPLPGVKKIHLTHRGLQSLNGLSGLSNLEYFTLEGAPLEILDMGPLPHLKVAKMVGCGSLRDLGGLEAQRKGLLAILENCPSLTSTAGLGNAQWVNIQKCPGINNLEGFADNPAVQSGEEGWYGRDVRAVSSSTLRSSPCFSAVVQDQWKSGERVSPVLDLGNTALTDLSSLGPAARPGIPGVNLAGCASLVSLKGLEVFEDLCFLDLRGCGQLSDVGSLGERKGPLCVVISVDGDALPGGVMAALAALQELHLVVIDQDHALKDLSALKGLKGLRGLDLVESGYRDTLDGSKTTALSIQNLSPLVSAADLRALRLPGSCLPPRCGPVREGTTSQGSIRNFRKGLAKALGVSFSKEETAPKKPAPKGLRSTVSKLRKLLTASDFSSIHQGVELLSAAGIPEAWDALVGGMDPGSAFISGNGKEDMAGMGTVFSRGRVVDAPYARYASLCVLATAPEEATEAAAIRDQVRSIQINVTEGQDYGGFKSALPPLPSLMKFTGLKAVTVFGTLEGETLDGLGVPSLEILCLPEMPALKDVSALQTCSDLKSLSLGTSDLQTLSGCESLPTLEHVALASPKLASLKALSAAKGLKSLKLHGCASLDTLSGIESAEELSAFHCTECPALVDLSALAGKAALSRTVHPSA